MERDLVRDRQVARLMKRDKPKKTSPTPYWALSSYTQVERDVGTMMRRAFDDDSFNTIHGILRERNILLDEINVTDEPSRPYKLYELKARDYFGKQLVSEFSEYDLARVNSMEQLEDFLMHVDFRKV